MRLIELWFFRGWTSVYFLKNLENLFLSERYKLQNSMGRMILCVYVSYTNKYIYMPTYSYEISGGI